MRQTACLALFAAVIVAPAFAQDAALVIGNENYRNAADITSADDALDAADALEVAGFTMRKGADLTAPVMRTLLAKHYDDTVRPGRSVILLTGHFVHAGAETWLVATGADQPTLASIDNAGLSLSTVLAIAGERPGGALVLLGTEDRRIDLGRGLAAGVGPVDVPQGVTVIEGDAAEVSAFAGHLADMRGRTMAELVASAEDLRAVGYIGTFAPFLPIPDGNAPKPATPPAGGGEQAFWTATEAIGTRAAFETYLDRFPDGAHAAAAKSAIARLDDPAAQAEAAEAALRLTRDQRREVQRNLSILDIDPKGIDGVFGPGSRNAIKVWQTRAGYDGTGFLTGRQLEVLAQEADKRAAELEAEAAARKAEQDQQDRLYWDQTGAAGDEAGLRAYLKRYPDGLFAELAQERLSVFDEERRAQAAANDRQAWDAAQKTDTVRVYQDYVAAHPNGAFVEEARRRIAELSETSAEADARQKAEAAEKALNLNPVMRSLVEQRLAALGLKPGAADGTFDDETRRAIRRYQQARGLPVTGYLNQQTVARLLVDSL
ncbi:peptidoglycan-binding domain-containing protein [Defluviimonas sp. SAOS-178_SWC]|uniref:peptidoglycan-binding domain-containing protein n=1 Tax=Defluviimonas sp. SAOS-178_SWC TaxID=3121287 RepID=UPI00322152AB